jgi:hypothetical protein
VPMNIHCILFFVDCCFDMDEVKDEVLQCVI